MTQKQTSSLRQRAIRITLLTFGFAAAGCFPSTAAAPGPLSANSVSWGTAHWPGTTPADLEKGHDVFLSSCNRCHGYPNLMAKTDDHWPHTIESMGNKAHLDAAQKETLLHFVLAFRADKTR